MGLVDMAAHAGWARDPAQTAPARQDAQPMVERPRRSATIRLGSAAEESAKPALPRQTQGRKRRERLATVNQIRFILSLQRRLSLPLLASDRQLSINFTEASNLIDHLKEALPTGRGP
jgi:hypothetical protein